MNRKCGCFGRFAAASVVPAKRYNQLVPSLFLDGETALDQYLDPAVERQIRKLLEYVTKNPQRGAKVSRRLARRLRGALSRRRWGAALVVARTYKELLLGLPPGDAPLLAWELVAARVGKGGGHDTMPSGGIVAAARESVIGLLFSCPLDDLRTAGALLLTQFADLQTNADYLPQLNSFAQTLIAFLSEFPSTLPKQDTGSGKRPLTSPSLAAAAINALEAIDSLAARVNMIFGNQVEAVMAVVRIFGIATRPKPNAHMYAPTSKPVDPKMEPPASAATAFVTYYSGRTETVLGARKRLEILYKGAEAAEVWASHESAQPFMDAVKRGLKHQYQLHFGYVMLTQHASALIPVQRQVASTAATGLWQRLDRKFISASESMTRRRSKSDTEFVNTIPGIFVRSASAPDKQPHGNSSTSAVAAGNSSKANGLIATSSARIAAKPEPRGSNSTEDFLYTKLDQSYVQTSQDEEPDAQLTLSRWLKAMGVVSMNERPPAALFRSLRA